VSYQGLGNMYTNSFETVDEVADHTDMMGQASVMNHQGVPADWRSNPTKQLIVLWVVCVVLYGLLMTFFRRHMG
jgi:hypothetical protein